MGSNLGLEQFSSLWVFSQELCKSILFIQVSEDVRFDLLGVQLEGVYAFPWVVSIQRPVTRIDGLFLDQAQVFDVIAPINTGS